MEYEIPLTHWSSSIMALNPEKLSHDEGTVIRRVSRDDPHALQLIVERNHDKYIGDISFFEIDYFGENSSTHELPRVIQNIYDSFEISCSSELVGRDVMGVYFYQNLLVGIQRAD